MKVTELEGISEYRTDNGVRVLLFPDESKDVVTVNMTVFVGSRHEGYGESGMAHLLEHMLFKGTPTHPNVPKVLQDRGATFNGTTWMDRTNYYETLPANEENLEFALKLEADRLINSNIAGEDLESEMTVVRNEFEQGENSPFRILMQRIQAVAYEWHNYGKSTIGNRSDIERVPVVRLRNFYRKFYRPDNSMVIISGNFDPDKALDLVDKYFGSLPVPEEPIDDTYTIEPPQDGERTVALRRVGDVQLVGAAYHVPPSSHPDFAAVKTLVYVLADEPGGRLYKQLVETDLASNVYAMASAFHDPGLMLAIVEVPKSESLETARSKMLEVIEQDLKENPITDEEIERAKQQILKNRELQANDTKQIAIALSDWAAQGDWRLYFLYRDRVEALTKEDVQKAAESYFVRNNRTVGLFIPTEEAQRITIPEAPDLNRLLADYEGREEVQAGESFDPDPAAIEARTERGELAGGIKYAFLPKKTRGGSVAVMLTLRFGTGETLKGRVAASELIGSMMGRGTKQFDYQQFQDELTRLRAELSVNSTPALVQMRVKTKREFLPEVLDLIRQVVREPRFEGEELEVLRRKVITSLESSLNEPQALAPRAVRSKLSPYGKDDIRYVPTLEEEIEMYRDVTIDEIRELYDEFLGNQAGELAVVGDFDLETVKSSFQETFADWTAKEEYERLKQPAHPEIEGGIELIETPDKSNAVLYSSQQYELTDDSEQYPGLLMGNFILGGGSLSSRLADRVRQQEGLSYGIRSGVTARKRDDRTDFTLYAITNPQNKDRLIEVIREEIDKLRESGVTEDELSRAKEAYLQQERVQRTNDANLAGLMIATLMNDRTFLFYEELDQRVRDATEDDVNQAIRQYIDDDRLVVAVAGDFSGTADEEEEDESETETGEKAETADASE
ncbi:MAG: pitrilysin family protein [Pirellulaceae bacterium]